MWLLQLLSFRFSSCNVLTPSKAWRFRQRSPRSCAAGGRGAASRAQPRSRSKRSRGRSSPGTSREDRRRSTPERSRAPAVPTGRSCGRGAPPRSVRPHLLFPLVEVVAGVFDFLAQKLTPRSRITRAADQRRTGQVVRLAVVPIRGEGDRSSFGNVTIGNCANPRRTNRHGLDTRTRQGGLQHGVVLDVVARPQDRVRNAELAQCVLNRQLRRKVWHVAELLYLEYGQIGNMLQS